MRVLISGGGFVGHRLCSSILAYGELVGAQEEREAVGEVVLLGPAAVPQDLLSNARVRSVRCEFPGPMQCAELVDRDGMIVFHFALADTDEAGELDRGHLENVHAITSGLLEACQHRRGVRFVLVSDEASLRHLPRDSGAAPAAQEDDVGIRAEVLVSEQSRRGSIDIRVARFPTVVPSPHGSAGLLDAFSAVVREPLRGRSPALPVRAGVPLEVCGFRVAVQNLLRLSQLPQAVFGTAASRCVSMPGLRLTLDDLHAGLRRVLRDPGALPPLAHTATAADAAGLAAWRRGDDSTGALSHRMQRDASADAIAADFVAEYVDKELLLPVLEVQQEPRHNFVLTNDTVRVYRALVPPGDKTLMHAHRHDAVYFFFTRTLYRNMLEAGPMSVPEEETRVGEVRYGCHADCPLIHKFSINPSTPIVVMCVELAKFVPQVDAGGEVGRPLSEGPSHGAPDGMTLSEERRGARVWELHVDEGASWRGTVPFPRMLWVVGQAAEVRGTFGDRWLMPADLFYHEGPLDVDLQVLSSSPGKGQEQCRSLFWIVECL